MTTYTQVVDVVPRAHYSANGIQTAFPFTFPIFDAEDMEVWVDQTRQSTGGYSVSGIGVAVGGTVIFTVPPPPSTQVTLRRRMALKRTAEFPDTAVEAKPLNDALYYQMAALQQVADDTALAVKRSFRSLSTADLTLPDPVAGRSIRWNDAGTGLINSTADIDAILSQVDTRVEAATDSAAAASASQTAAASFATNAATARAACDADVAATGADRAAVSTDRASVAADRLTVQASRTAADASATAAALSKTAAQASQTAAQASQTAAALSAADATTSKTGAAASAATAQTAAGAASASQVSARASEISASGSASAAAASAAQAQAAAGVYTFTNVAVAGQSTVSADQAGDTLTLVAGTALAITTDAAADTVTIAVNQSGLEALIGLSSAGRALIDDADATAQRTTLGLGTAATRNSGNGAANLPTVAAMHAMAAALAV